MSDARSPAVARSLFRRATAAVATSIALAAGLTARPAAAQAAQQADLVLNMSAAPDPVPAGGRVTYQAIVNNDGAATATGVTFTFQLPSNARFVAAGGTGATCSGIAAGQVGPATLSCTVPSLPYSISDTVSIQVRTLTQGVMAATAHTATATPEVQYTNNDVTVQSTVTAGADVALVLTGSSSAMSGATIGYALQVTNAGPDAASYLQIQFPIPSGFSVASVPAGCTTGGSTITCNVSGSVAASGSVTVGTVTGQIVAAGGSTLSATASVGVVAGAPSTTAQDPNTTDNTAITNTRVTSGSDVALTLTRSTNGPFIVGQGFTFTLNASYTGDSPSGLTLVDTLPAVYQVNTGTFATTQGAWSCAVSAGPPQVVTCTRAAGVGAGSNKSLGAISVPVTIVAAGAATNLATIAAASPTDPNTSNNAASDGGATTQLPSADLSTSLSGPSPALTVVGQSFTIQQGTKNNGPAGFSGVLIVTDTVPAGLTLTGVTGSGWSCATVPATGPAELTCRRSYAAGAPLASGASAPTLALAFTSTTNTSLTFVGHVLSDSASATDPTLANNAASFMMRASVGSDAADVAVTQTASPDPVPAGDVLAYTIEVQNAGPVAAQNVKLSDTFSGLINTGSGATGAGYVSLQILSGVVQAGTITCNDAAYGSGRNLVCTIPTLPTCTVGSDCPRFVVMVRPGGDGGVRTNTATATSQNTADPSYANNSATTSVTVLPRADVYASHTGTPNPTPAGQLLTYSVGVGNNGPSLAQGVTLVDTLPVGVLFVSASPSAGSCGTTPAAGTVTTSASRIVSCTIGTLTNGQQQVVTVKVRPTDALLNQSIAATTVVATTTTEPTSPGASNNAASFSSQVGPPSLDLLVHNLDSVDPVAIGDTTVYNISVTNVGPSDAENVVVTDTLNATRLAFLSVTPPPGGACSGMPAPGAIGGILTCTIPRLAAGATTPIAVAMQGVAKGVTTNTAVVASDETALGVENPANNTAPQATTVRTRADLQVVSITPSVDTVAVRRPFTWTVRVQNNAGARLTEADTVQVTSTFPSGLVLTGAPTAAVVSGTATQATCTGNPGDGSFSCAFGTLSSGGVVDVTVPVRVLTVPGGAAAAPVSTSATATTTSLDVLPSNNTNTGGVVVQGSSLAGQVFRDFNGNLTADSGQDTGISGVTVTLSGSAYDGTTVSQSTTTNGTGAFSFVGLPDGTYGLTRGTVNEPLLPVAVQAAGTAGGNDASVPTISAIALPARTAATNYRFTFSPQARVGVAKRLAASVTPNADGTFTADTRVVVQNYSREPLASVVVSDTLAGGASGALGGASRFGAYVAGGSAAALTPGTYTVQVAPAFTTACANGTATAGFDGATSPALAQVSTMAAGTSCEVGFAIRYKPLVPLPAAGYANLAYASGSGSYSGQNTTDASQNGTNPDPDGDGDPTNNSAPTTYPTTLQADVTTTVAVPGTVDAGQPVAGTVLYKNVGPYTAASVTFTLTLTPGLAGVTVGNLPTGATASYNATSGVVALTGMPATLAAGQIASGDGTNPLTLGYTQPGSASSTLASGIGTSTPQGTNAAPDSARATVAGALVADVTTTLALPASANAATPVSGTVTYRNTGPSTASGVTYALTLTPGLAGVTVGNLPTGAAATYNAVTGAVTLAGMPATLAAGQVASGNGTTGLAVGYTQNAVAATTARSGIGTTTSQGANAAPDSASATIGGQLIADVTTTLAFPTRVDAGGQVTGMVVYRNTGPSTASGMTYALTLVPNLTGVTVGNLPAGATATYNATSGAVALTGMPATLATAQLASGDGVGGITVAYTQPAAAVSTVTSHVGTTTNQGANVALDDASVSPGGAPVADVRTIIATPAAVNAGQLVSGTVRYLNTGPSRGTAMIYALTLTPGLAGVAFTNLPAGASATYAPTTGVVTFAGMPGALAADSTASGDGTAGIGVAYVQPPAATSAWLGVIGTATSQGPNYAPDTARATIGGAPVADVTAALRFPVRATAGDSVRGLVLFRNTGPSPSAGMTYAVSLTPGLPGISLGNLPSGATGSYDPTTGTVTFVGMPASLAADTSSGGTDPVPGSVASGDARTGVTLAYVQPARPDGTTIAARLATTTDEGPNTAPDSAATPVGAASADLAVTNVSTATLVQPNDTVTYTVRTTNHGPVALPAGSRLTYAPTGVTLLDVACTGLAENVCAGTPAGIADLQTPAGAALPPLAVGAAYELRIRAGVAVTSGNIATAARVQPATGFLDTNAANDTATAAQGLHTGPDLAISRTFAAAFYAGGTTAYVLPVTNGGPGTTTAPLVVTEQLPAMLTFVAGGAALPGVSAGGTDGWSCASTDGHLVRCTAPGPLAPGAITRIPVQVRVAANATGSFTMTATVTTANDGAHGQKSTATGAAFLAGPDLALVKTAGTDTLRVGTPVVYTLALRNLGPAAPNDTVTVVDTLATGLTPTTAAGAGFACTITGQVVACAGLQPALVGPATAPVTVTAGVTGTVGAAPVLNVACARVAGDANSANDCGRLTLPVVGLGALRVVKTAASAEYVVGRPGDFHLAVRNEGSVTAPGPITLTDSLPAGLGFLATPDGAAAGWSCATGTGTAAPVVTCTRPTGLAAGDSTHLTLRTAIGVAAVPQVTNCARLSAAQAGLAPGGDRSCATIAVRTDYRLALEISTPRYERELGDVPDFTLTVRNVGESPLPAVAVQAALPAGFRYVPNTSTREGARIADPTPLGARTAMTGAAALGGNALLWPVGPLAAGQVAHVTYRARLGVGVRLDAENVTPAIAADTTVSPLTRSNLAQAPIRLRAGVFTDRGVIAGKVYVSCGCDTADGARRHLTQRATDVGIPGVRIVLENGTRAVTDAEGKYSFPDVPAGLHVVHVDRSTLPAGARLVALDSRNAGDGMSRFVDLRRGELARSDFADGARADSVVQAVLARRATAATGAARADGSALGGDLVALDGRGQFAADGSALRPADGLRPNAQTFRRYQPLLPGSLRSALAMGGAGPIGAPGVMGGGLMGGSVLGGAQGGIGTLGDGGIAPGGTVPPVAPASEPGSGFTTAGVPATPQPLVAVGLLAGRFDLRAISRGGLAGAGGLASLDDFGDAIRGIRWSSDTTRGRWLVGGLRGALYLTGTVAHAGLVTLRYDTERDPEQTAFRDIRPDAGFPVFGDASAREFDAQSRSALALRIDRGASFLRFGDFSTGRADDGRLLLPFVRTLTGVQQFAEGRHGFLTAFASRTTTRLVVDELPGRGLSGVYQLSHPTFVPNSERIELVTRDRDQPAVVLARTVLERFTDYTLDPLTGVLVFRHPVPSMDERLDPVAIRVLYEVDQGGSASAVYGGEAAARLGDRIELGVTAAHDANALAPSTVAGGTATVALGGGTYLLGEVAHTVGGTAPVGTGILTGGGVGGQTTDGTLASTTLGDAQPTGDAWRAELRHRSAHAEARLYAIRADTGFLNPGAPFTGGRAEYGARGLWRFDARTSVLLDALRTEDLRTGGTRTGADLALARRFAPWATAEVGYRVAHETTTPASSLTADVGATGTSLAATPLAEQSVRGRLTVSPSRPVAVFGEFEHAVDGSAARRIAAGADLRVASLARLYARQEWTDGYAGPFALSAGEHQSNTVFGVASAYGAGPTGPTTGEVFSEYRARDAFSGRDAEAAIGLRNRWTLAPGLRITTAVERVAPVVRTDTSAASPTTGSVTTGTGAPTLTGPALALAGGLEWTTSPLWKLTARAEWRRTSSGDDALASFGLARKLSRDWTVLGRTLWDQVQGGQQRERSQLAFAWRETDGNAVNGLFRLEHLTDHTDATGAATDRSTAFVGAGLLNVQPSLGTVFSGRIAAKRADDLSDGLLTRTTAALLMARVTQDVSRRLDLGLIGSVLAGDGSTTRQYGAGAELGVRAFTNTRLTLGYNVFGFTDRDFASLGYTQRGPYIGFGVKFDESLFRAGHTASPTPAAARGAH